MFRGAGGQPFRYPSEVLVIIIWVWQYCFALLRLRLIDEQSKYAKNGRSKLQGRCELSGGQRLASFVYLVYCPSARPG
jgi:hypothetical protein